RLRAEAETFWFRTIRKDKSGRYFSWQADLHYEPERRNLLFRIMAIKNIKRLPYFVNIGG
ncbi:MAG: hypothetical protein NC124_04690, partial [Clostridium sp.]|nr:hypothetical protein [Clostridium sp.]